MQTIATECPMPVATQTADAAGRTGEEMLTEWFQPLYAAVHRFLLHRFFDAELAEELTAETFFRAVRGVKRFRGCLSQLRVWLLRTASNLANTHQRRRRLWQLVFPRLAQSRPVTELSLPDGCDNQRPGPQEIQASLAALATRHQNVIVLRYLMDMSFEEIGAVLRCRQDAVRSRLSRAVKAMRRQLGVRMKR